MPFHLLEYRLIYKGGGREERREEGRRERREKYAIVNAYGRSVTTPAQRKLVAPGPSNSQRQPAHDKAESTDRSSGSQELEVRGIQDEGVDAAAEERHARREESRRGRVAPRHEQRHRVDELDVPG